MKEQQGEYHVKHDVTLTGASLLSILFTTFHHSDDVARGLAPGGLSNLVPVFFLVVWLYGTLVLAGRRPGYVIILVVSLLASGLPLVHMMGSGLAGGKNDNSGGAFFFGWTLLALEVTALFSVILSARGLWGLRPGRAL
jgi:hypothetical protein